MRRSRPSTRLTIACSSSAVAAISVPWTRWLSAPERRPTQISAGLLPINLGQPSGAAFDHATGILHVLDASRGRIVSIMPVQTIGSEARDFGTAITRAFALRGVDRRDMYGLAINPDNSHFYAFSKSGEDLYEFGTSGTLLATHDIGAAGIVAPLDMVFAPSADPTDDPGQQSLYVVDAEATVGMPASTRVVELSFVPVILAEEPTIISNLVQTIDTSLFVPSSPDPAGIAYLAGEDRLMIVDSEVNEMTIFAGVNLFEITRTGAVEDTGVTTSFSDEPTGVAINGSNGQMFVSDDVAREIFVVDPGPDAKYGTGDDILISSFDTAGFGSTDPEGVTYDSLRNEVVIIDGVGREVYRVAPGPNGLFDGLDDSVTQFDVQALGADDPEGITYDAVNDTLLIVDRGPDIVLEISTVGTLIRTMDISAAAANPKAAGIVLAPSTANPAEMSMFIVDRGVDNCSDPNENDGLLYEMSLPNLSGNQAPSVAAGPDQSLALTTDIATLDGTITDDGLPDPPAASTALWTQEAGTAGVVFDDATAVDTTASFPGPGVYVLRLTGDDSELSSFDELTVSVSVLEMRVSATTDDAEERPPGGVSLTSSDLELVEDPSRGVQTVGLRFVGVEVPAGSTVTGAWVQFQADEADGVVTSLTIEGEASDDAVTFSSASLDVSSRPRTTASAGWVPVAWNIVGEGGPDQQTPDLSAVVQEIIDRPGWASGNAVVIIVTGSGERTAESFDGNHPEGAPLLHVEFSSDPPLNQPPVAVDDTAVTSQDTAVLILASGNDSDPDGNLDPTSVNTSCVGCSVPSDGLLVNLGDGSFSYTPDLGFNGSDSFVYEICDTEPLCDTATVSITVTVVNDPPVANPDSESTAEDTAVLIDVIGNDTDPDGNLDPTSVNTSCLGCVVPSDGLLINHGDGTFTYIPNQDFNGSDVFVYEVCDLLGLCDMATVSLTVDAVNDPPVVVDDDALTLVDVAVVVDVAANDTDVDGDLDVASTNTTCVGCSVPSDGSLVNLVGRVVLLHPGSCVHRFGFVRL